MPEHTSIRTAQNVIIDVPIAGLDKRILANLVDYIIMVGYGLFMFLIFSLLSPSTSLNGIIVILTILALPIIFYHFLFETFNEGQSPGKKALGIRVVTELGEKATVTQYFIRWIMRIVDFSILSGLVALITAAATDKTQRVGDLVAGTVVILTDAGMDAGNSVRINVQEDYEPTYKVAGDLPQDEIEAIKEVIDLPQSDAREGFIVELAKKVSEKYAIRYEGTPKKFLYDILKDHQYLTSIDEEDLYDDSDLV